MNLFINGYPIEFELENEKTVKEVVATIEKWAVERYLIFTDVVVDEESFSIENLPDRDISQIKAVDCLMQSRSEIIISSLTEGVSYCDRVKSYIDEANSSDKFKMEELDFLYTGLQWLRDMCEKVFNLVELKIDEIKYMDKMVVDHLNSLNSFKEELSKLSDEKEVLAYLYEKKDFFDIFRGIFKLVLISQNLKEVITKSIDSPDVLINSLKSIMDNLDEQMKNLEEASVAFQSGNDKEGGEKVSTFIDFIYLYTRTCYQIVPVFTIKPEEIEVDGVNLEDKNSEINQFLEEIIDVMENNDIISLSDILEYEIKPAMENLGDYVKIILDRIG